MKVANSASGQTDSVTEILLHSEHWSVVYSCVSGPVVPLAGASVERRTWSQRHAHRNTHREILLCVAGQGWFGMGGTLYPCRPGTLFVMDPRAPHDNYYPTTATGLEHVWIRVLGARVFVGWYCIDGGKLTRQQEHLSVLTEEQLGVCLKEFPAATAVLASPYDVARIRLLAGLVAAYLGQHRHPRANVSSRDPAVSMRDKVIEAVRRHIEESAGAGVTLDFLAHFSGYSKFHLLRLFRAHVGCSIHQYVDRARWERVRQMQASGATCRAMSEALGFSSPTAFHHWRGQRA